tara:strand:- start:1003 stop:1656 length:654 start_codon:yes stop_codon:yes gene_type:complete
MQEIPEVICVGGNKTPTVSERASQGFTFNKFKKIFPRGVVLITPKGNELYIPPRTFEKIRKRVKDIESHKIYRNHNSSTLDDQEIENLFDSINIAELFNHIQTHGPIQSKRREMIDYGLSPAQLILDVATQVDYLLPIIKEHMRLNKKLILNYLKKKMQNVVKYPYDTNPTYAFILGGYPILVSLASENPNRLIFKSLYEQGGIWPNNTCHIDYRVI